MSRSNSSPLQRKQTQPRWEAPRPRWQNLQVTLAEAGVQLNVGAPDAATGGLSYSGAGFCNPKMGLYRDFATLSALTLFEQLRQSHREEAVGENGSSGFDEGNEDFRVGVNASDSGNEAASPVARANDDDDDDSESDLSWEFPAPESTSVAGAAGKSQDAHPAVCPHVQAPALVRAATPGPVFRFFDVFCGTGALGLRIARAFTSRFENDNDDNDDDDDDDDDNDVVAQDKRMRQTRHAPQWCVEVILNDASSACSALARRNVAENLFLLDQSPLPALSTVHGLRREERCKEGSAPQNLSTTSSAAAAAAFARVRLRVTQADAQALLVLTATASTPYEPATHIHLDPFGCVTHVLDAAVSALDVRGCSDRANLNKVEQPGAPRTFRPPQNLLTMTSTDMSVLLDRRFVAKARRHYGVLHLSKDRGICFRESAARMVVASVVRACGRQDKGCRVLYCFAAEHFIMTCVTVDYQSRDAAASYLRMSERGEGPFYMGPLVDAAFVNAMVYRAGLSGGSDTPTTHLRPVRFSKPAWAFPKKLVSILLRLQSETPAAHVPWFYSLTSLGLNAKRDDVVEQLRKSGFSASRTIWDTNAIRTDAAEEAIREAVAIVESARKAANSDGRSSSKLSNPTSSSKRGKSSVDEPEFHAGPAKDHGVRERVQDDADAAEADAFSSDASALSDRERRRQRRLSKRSSSQSKKRRSPRSQTRRKDKGREDSDKVCGLLARSTDHVSDKQIPCTTLERKSGHLPERHHFEQKQEEPTLDPAKAMTVASIVAASACQDAEAAATAAAKALETAEEARDQATSPVAAEHLRVSMLARAGRATQEAIALEASASAARLRERKAKARLAMIKMVEHLRSHGLSESTDACATTKSPSSSTSTPVLMSHSGDLGLWSRSLSASTQASGARSDLRAAPYDEKFLWKRQLDLDFDWGSVPLSNDAESPGEQIESNLTPPSHHHTVEGGDEAARDWSWWAHVGQPVSGAPLTTAERVALTLRELGIVDVSDLDLVTHSDLESRFVPAHIVAQILAISKSSSAGGAGGGGGGGGGGGARP